MSLSVMIKVLKSMEKGSYGVMCLVCVYMIGKATCRKNFHKVPKVFLNFFPEVFIESEVVQTQTEEKRSVCITTLPLSLSSFRRNSFCLEFPL